MRYQLTLVKIQLSSKNPQTINSGENVERRDPSYTVGGHGYWCSPYGEQYGSSLKKLKTELTYDLAIPFLSIYQKRIWSQRIHAPQYSLSTTYNSQDNEAI